VHVERTNESSEFLTSRRAKVTPAQAGLPSYGKRRVPGLRREESRLRSPQQRIRPSVQRILDALNAPAYVRNNRRDLLAANALGQALYSELYLDPVRPVNVARFVFLNPRAQDFFPDWDGVADDAVASLRIEAGRTPFDRGLSDLVGELSTRSEEFRTRWAAHNVRFHRAGAKRLHHPIVGELDLTFEAMDLTADAGLTVVTYSAEPGSRSEEGLNLLASWTATLHLQEDTARAADETRRPS
jgi:hypothetical protein